MYVRLAFSTAIHIDPQILIVDEALAVGDAIFASRCIRKFEELRQRKVTVLLVSHDLGLVKRLADRAAFMIEGKVVMLGSPKDAVNRYVGFVLDREKGPPGEARPLETPGAKSSFRHGDGASRIVDIRLMNAAREPCRAFRPGDAMLIQVPAVVRQAVSNPVVGILIRNRIGMDVYGTNTRLEHIELGQFEAGEALEVEFELACFLSRQYNTLTIATPF